jgi:hypothetical protein
MRPTLTRLLAVLRPLSSGAFWRAQYGQWLAKRFDTRYGTDTVRQVAVAAMQGVPITLAEHAVHYEATAIPKLRCALRVVKRQLGPALGEFAFVDIGSGKGLAVMLASRAGFRQVYGVEMSPELHLIAESNRQLFVARHRDAAPIHLTCMDALQYELPAGDMVIYLYNPFSAVLMSAFIGRLRSLDGAPRQVLLAYVNPLHQHLFDADSHFTCLFDDGRVSVFSFMPALKQVGSDVVRSMNDGSERVTP